MTTQPLTKSDWDGHPVWWVRSCEHAIQRQIVGFSPSGVSFWGRTRPGLGEMLCECKSWDQLDEEGYERSHDRITWEPCSKPAKESPQPDTVDVEKLIEALSCEDVHGNSVLRGWPMVTSTGINATRRALAALHPRLKEEVEK